MTDTPQTPEEQEPPAEGEVPERQLPEQAVLRALIEPFENVEWAPSGNQDVAVVPKAELRDFARAAREAGFELCMDVTAVDYLRARRVRFEVVANLLSHQHNLRLRVRVPVPADDPEVPSLVPVYPGTNFFEREVYDMFGILFEGHPDMTRILMPDDWVGYPLRKDFATGQVPVQFKGAHKVS